MIKLQWLRINKFRRVKPGTLLTFNPGYNVLLGQNGTGKTTLLSLVASVVSSKFSDFIDEEFELEYELETDEAKMRVLVKNATQPLVLEREQGSSQTYAKLLGTMLRRLGTDPKGLILSSEIQIRTKSSPVLNLNFSGGRTVGLVFSDEASAAEVPFTTGLISSDQAFDAGTLIRGIVAWFGSNRAFKKFDLSDEALAELVHKAIVFAQIYARRFDESLNYFSELGGDGTEIMLLPNGMPVVGGAPVAQAVFEKLVDAAQNKWGEIRYTLVGDQIPFLEKLTRLFGFCSAEVVFEFERVSNEEHAESLKSGSQKFFFTHEGGWKISDRHLSYGQKRMLAFMYYLECTEHIAIVDELVNGLHHNWIQACIEELGQRQGFLTSQNPLLLDYLTFDSPEEVRSRFVLCRWEQDTKQMGWENMSKEAAEDFFASYKVGFQQVGELLQSKGLW